MSSISETTNTASAGKSLDQSLSSSQDVARANLYHFLARAFSSPLVMEEDYPEQFGLVIPYIDPVLQKPGLTLAQTWEDALNDRQALLLAYSRLFLGPFMIISPPYASYYLESDQQLMGDVSQDVAHRYAAAGLEPGEGANEAPDHIALEWEYLYYLTYRYITTGEECWIWQRAQFILTHMNRWVPTLAERMVKSGEHNFYQALAEFVRFLLLVESEQN